MNVVGGGKKKQDVIIADSTGSATYSIWQKVVGSLEVGQIELHVHIQRKDQTFSFAIRSPC